MSKFEDMIGMLWGCRVYDYNVDMLQHRIYLDVVRNYDGTEEKFEVVFKNVLSFVWINDCGETRKILSEWEFLDLVSFDTVSDTAIRIIGDEFASQYCATPNICIEIWNSILLIEAEKVSIGNQEFVLK
ncbi:hypothetical protein [Brevibacillus brevis]|uniref:Uncharacterized protein n=1 Tax=Brevibacillus brevis TaxID=1393 RepID=A0ABY9T4V9_BREBE|nr:hypothetical protein [Brevibacillus brevis]WNC14271.1 hypothetical protein RGB73_26925 [Brevibacillus brevis]